MAGWTPPPEELAQTRGKRVLVMGSGNGSNFEAITTTLQPLGIEIAGLFCDREGAFILKRAERLGVPTFQPSPLPEGSDLHPKRHLNNEVLRFLEQPFDVLALAGYMRILPKRVVAAHPGKILNIHPSLLPAYPGLHAIEKAYNAGETRLGITVHIVNELVDDGPILGQSALDVQEGESLASVETRIHTLEHDLYPRMIFAFLAGASPQGEL